MISKPTPTGKIMVDFLRGAMPAFIDTGLNVVDVRDVAEGHLLACERGKPGERYILGGENLTLEEIFARARANQRREGAGEAHSLCAGLRGGRGHDGLGGVTGREPRAPLDAVRMARKKMWVTHEKAARELGYAPGPAEAALAARGRVVPVQWLLLRAAKLLLVACRAAANCAEFCGAFEGGPRRCAGRYGSPRIGEIERKPGGCGRQRPRTEGAWLPRASGLRWSASRPEAVVSTGFCGALDPAHRGWTRYLSRERWKRAVPHYAGGDAAEGRPILPDGDATLPGSGDRRAVRKPASQMRGGRRGHGGWRGRPGGVPEPAAVLLHSRGPGPGDGRVCTEFQFFARRGRTFQP